MLIHRGLPDAAAISQASSSLVIIGLVAPAPSVAARRRGMRVGPGRGGRLWRTRLQLARYGAVRTREVVAKALKESTLDHLPQPDAVLLHLLQEGLERRYGREEKVEGRSLRIIDPRR